MTATCWPTTAVGLVASDADSNGTRLSKVGYREAPNRPSSRRRGARPAPAAATACGLRRDDLVAALPLGADGFRGAVGLGGHVSRQYDGVVGGGVVVAARAGADARCGRRGARRIRVVRGGRRHGARRSEVAGSRTNLSDAYVAVGATAVSVDDASGFAAGDTVVVERAPSAEWIASIGAWSPAQIYMLQG